MMIVLFFISSKSYGKADKLKCLTLWMRLNSSLRFSSCFHLQVNTIIRILLFLLSDFIFWIIIITITPWERVCVWVFVFMSAKRMHSRCNSLIFVVCTFLLFSVCCVTFFSLKLLTNLLVFVFRLNVNAYFLANCVMDS